MKLQFLETYGLDYFTLKEVFPLYSSLWDKVEDLRHELKKCTSDRKLLKKDFIIKLIEVGCDATRTD